MNIETHNEYVKHKMMSSALKKTSVRDILNRLKMLAGVANDIDLAEPLQVSARNVANWKARDSIPWDYINDYCARSGYSLDYVINGIGEAQASRLEDAGGIYQVRTDQDVVYDIAASIYTALQQQGKAADPAQFRQLVKVLHRGMLENGKAPTAEKINEIVALI